MPIETEVLEIDQGKVLCVTPITVNAFHGEASFPVVVEAEMQPDVKAIDEPRA